MKSPEAVKVMISYKKDKYQTAIDEMEKLGRMKVELAKVMHANEEYEIIKLKILECGETFRVEIEKLKREREEEEKIFEMKMSESQTNIEREEISQEGMKQVLAEEENHYINERLDKKFKEVKMKHEETIKELQKELKFDNSKRSETEILELQKQLEKLKSDKSKRSKSYKRWIARNSKIKKNK
jgi:hypothetical protein